MFDVIIEHTSDNKGIGGRDKHTADTLNTVIAIFGHCPEDKNHNDVAGVAAAPGLVALLVKAVGSRIHNVESLL